MVKLNGVARRLRGTAVAVANAMPMETVVCGKCGQRFAIENDPDARSGDLIRRQASFVADQLIWDHIQERKHHGRIELPGLS